MAQAPVLPRGFELPLEPRLPRIGSVDAVALEERAASLAKRSIKREAKVFALDLAVRMMDLTTLEGQDTPGKVAALASKAIRPDPSDGSVPAGADFIKTSTGKLPGAATLPVTLCMLEAIRDVHAETGRMVGMKPAGGIREAKQAVQYLVQLHETLGPDWLTPDLYRLGASSLLNDVLMQLRKE